MHAPTDWTQLAVAISLDGASVNTGHKTGLKALLNKRADWMRLVHGLAHVVELCANAACKSVPYFSEEMVKICKQAVSTYNYSGKKQWNCRQISIELNEAKHRKLTSFCATRFQRALTNALKALITNWRATAVHLHELAHREVNTRQEWRDESLTLRSPLADFVGRSYLRQFTGCKELYTVKITGVTGAPAEGESELDQPFLEAKVTPATRGYKQEPLFKAEVVDQIDPSDRLEKSSHYQLYNQLTSARFIKSALFMMDARAPQARLSELTQRDNMSLKSLSRKLSSISSDLEAMKLKPEANEASFNQLYSPDREVFRGIQVLNQGLDEFEKDRKAYLEALQQELQSPALQLTDPVDTALREYLITRVGRIKWQATTLILTWRLWPITIRLSSQDIAATLTCTS